MNHALRALAARELSSAAKNRWLLAFAAAFAALGLVVASTGSAGSALGGSAGFGRTTAALVHLVLLAVPLMGLVAGAAAIPAERERRTLEPLLAMPVRASDVFWAKFLGASTALTAALGAAFGLIGVALAASSGLARAGIFLACFAATAGLAVASVAIGMAAASGADRVPKALGAALLLWVVFVFGGDLGLLATSLAARLPPEALLAAAWLNPLSLYRLLAIQASGGQLDALGPAGLCASDLLGRALAPAALAGLLAWIAIALALARRSFLADPLGSSK